MQHDDATKEWETIGSWVLVPSAINYKPKINSRTVQVERTGAGAQQGGGTADGLTDTIGEAQEGSRTTVNGADRLVRRPGQV